jgi:glycerol kinase
MQYQSDILNIPVLLPEITESTALGAAYLAGITAKVYNSVSEVAKLNNIRNRYDPDMTDGDREQQVKLWKNAIGRLLCKGN